MLDGERAAARRALMGDAMTNSTTRASEQSFLDRYFGLTQSGTSVRTEFVAGVTTFLTMVYIVFVNPDILGNAGMDKGAVFVATCLAAAISTLIMAFYANYPIALAPGMGLNAFFAFTLVLGYKYTWQQALAFVFLSGVLALIITATRLREYIINAIPRSLKLAVSAGVGLFLGIIALQQAGIVVDHPVTLVTLGDLKKWPAMLRCSASSSFSPSTTTRFWAARCSASSSSPSSAYRWGSPSTAASSRCRPRSRPPSCSSIFRACSRRPRWWSSSRCCLSTCSTPPGP